jgi:hypothetical protein
VAADENIAAVAAFPPMFHPNSVRTRRPYPFAFVPHIASADPLVITVGPYITRSRSDSDYPNMNRSRRSDSNNDFGGACGPDE